MYRILSDVSISDGEIFKDREYLVKDGCIIEHSTDTSKAEVIDLRGLTVMPGFIDTHVHGAMGYDVMDGNYKALDAISTYKIEEGCTSFCPATITAPMDKTITAIASIKNAMEKGVKGAYILGAFLEGPYINPKYKGAHPEEYIRPPSQKEFDGDCLASIIISPELPGATAAIRKFVERGLQVRLGHSAATIAEVEAAVAAGATVAVHSFNAMSPLHHREPGMVGAILTNPQLKGELICDLVHVHPKACKLLANCKGGAGIILVTDCMAAGGLADGKYKIGELDVEVRKGESRLPDGTLAGSTTTMLDCVRNMHQEVGVSLAEAVEMATATPAKSLGIFNRTGSLDIGKSADIIALDLDFNVRFVMVRGYCMKKPLENLPSKL